MGKQEWKWWVNLDKSLYPGEHLHLACKMWLHDIGWIKLDPCNQPSLSCSQVLTFAAFTYLIKSESCETRLSPSQQSGLKLSLAGNYKNTWTGKAFVVFVSLRSISSWPKSSTVTCYHVSGPFLSTLSAFLINAASGNNGPPDSLEERTLDIAGCDTVDLWALLDTSKIERMKSKVSKTENVENHISSLICEI